MNRLFQPHRLIAGAILLAFASQTDAVQFDPRTIEKWVQVDTVWNMEEFTPGIQRWEGKIRTDARKIYGRWSEDTIYHPGDQTTRKYVIRDIDKKTYLFIELNHPKYEKPRIHVYQPFLPKKPITKLAPRQSRPTLRELENDLAVYLRKIEKIEDMNVSEKQKRRLSFDIGKDMQQQPTIVLHLLSGRKRHFVRIEILRRQLHVFGN